MIRITENKISVSKNDYKILKDLYDAFRLDPYAVTLFCYGVKCGDLQIDQSIYDEAEKREIDAKDMFYEILKAVTTTDNYIIED